MRHSFLFAPPKVSVIIPLYQTERFIADAINCVRAQTYGNFEILIIDDGSTDHGPAIAASLNEPRMRIISQENRGLAGARNTGIREAQGEYLAFLDADDLWLPEKLAKHVDFLDANPAIGVSFSASRFIDDAGNDIGLVQRPAAGPLDAVHVFCRNPVGNGSAPVIRRAALDVVAFHDKALRRKCWFDESFRQSEDIECWTRIAVQGDWAFGLVDAELTKYRVSNEGLSADTGRQLATWRRFRAKVAIYAPDLDRQAGSLAEAYQLRYLSRRSVRSGKPGAALLLIIDAMRMDQRILRNEPTRTLITLAAAIAGCAVPAILFKQFQKLAISVIALKSIIRT